MIIERIFIVILALILVLNLAIRLLIKNLKEVENKTKLSGFEIAKKISNNEPHIIKKKGLMLDHYNLDRNVIKLSPEVFDGTDLYAGFVAFAIGYETKSENRSYVIGYKLADFLVLAAYITIILGSFLNNSMFIHFGMLIFIISFILEIVLLKICLQNKKREKSLYDIIKKEKVINPLEKYYKYSILGFIINIASLPYHFIVWFK